MAMNIANGEGDEDEVLSAINTTPLVDVMLVLLIIFLITIPVAIHTVPVNLPKAAVQPEVTRPQNITLAIDAAGAIFWNNERISGEAELSARMAAIAARKPQPEIHLRGDRETPFRSVDRIMAICRKAGIERLVFVTEPDRAGGR